MRKVNGTRRIKRRTVSPEVLKENLHATERLKPPIRPRERPPMRDYRVVWTIDIYETSAEEAARTARKIQLDPTNIATHFTVEGRDVEIVQYNRPDRFHYRQS